MMEWKHPSRWIVSQLKLSISISLPMWGCWSEPAHCMDSSRIARTVMHNTQYLIDYYITDAYVYVCVCMCTHVHALHVSIYMYI